MFGKIKKVFFTGMFGILYIAFVAQVAYALFGLENCEQALMAFAGLSVEWLVLIAARYLSKRSASNSGSFSGNGGYRRR